VSSGQHRWNIGVVAVAAAVSEGGAAVACGADGVCGVRLAWAVLRKVQEHNNETRAGIDFAQFTAHQVVSTGITSKGDHVETRPVRTG